LLIISATDLFFRQAHRPVDEWQAADVWLLLPVERNSKWRSFHCCTAGGVVSRRLPWWCLCSWRTVCWVLRASVSVWRRDSHRLWPAWHCYLLAWCRLTCKTHSNTCAVSHLYCITPVLSYCLTPVMSHTRTISHMHCLTPVLSYTCTVILSYTCNFSHLHCLTPVVYCLTPALYHTCTVRHMHCLTPVLTYTGTVVLTYTCTVLHLYCLTPVLSHTCIVSQLYCLTPVLSYILHQFNSIIHCVPKKHVTIFSAITLTISVQLQ